MDRIGEDIFIKGGTWAKVQLALQNILLGLGGIKIGHGTSRVAFVGLLSNHFHACHQSTLPEINSFCCFGTI